MEPLDIKIGPYTLVSKIGDGGMAEVFKARVERAGGFEKLVALKKILPNLASNEKFRRNFINEARICGQLHHHNIVEVYDFLQEGSDLCLAMEFIDGLNLEEVFNYHREVEQPVTSDVILSILVQTLEGLDYAHKANNPLDNKPLNVIHRDLKPSNILIDNEGVVKIVDFGVAKAANRRYETQEMTAKGTASYMSPEQLLGDKPVTSAADIFSVGTIFYELLTLGRLFDGEHVFAILKQVVTLDIDAHLNQTITGGDRKFLPILRKALARELDQRYQSAGDMLRDLQTLNIGGFSARRLADHLRKIRNVSESVEEARTRLVTDREFGDYLKDMDEGVIPTRVVDEDDLEEDEEDCVETMLDGEPVRPYSKTEATKKEMPSRAAIEGAAAAASLYPEPYPAPPVGEQDANSPDFTATESHAPVQKVEEAPSKVEPPVEPSGPSAAPQNDPAARTPQPTQTSQAPSSSMPSILQGGDASVIKITGQKSPTQSSRGSQSGVTPAPGSQAPSTFNDSQSIRIGPIKESASSLLLPIAIGAGVGLIILLIFFVR